MAVKGRENVLDFVIYSYLKDSLFTEVKRDAKFEPRYVKGVPFVTRRYTKGEPFLPKVLYKPRGRDSPYKIVLRTQPPLP